MEAHSGLRRFYPLEGGAPRDSSSAGGPRTPSNLERERERGRQGE